MRWLVNVIALNEQYVSNNKLITCVAVGKKSVLYRNVKFLADRTNGRAYATLLRPSVVVCRL